jgi:hypothetical protein
MGAYTWRDVLTVLEYENTNDAHPTVVLTRAVMGAPNFDTAGMLTN